MNPLSPSKSKSEVYEAWGWAASAARFRGLVALLLAVASAFLSVTSFFMYVSLSSQKVMVVGVEPSGNRSILMPTERAVNPEAFARTFIGNYTNYSPNTVTQNIREALLLSSPGFVKAHEIKFGSRLEEQIKDENVVQVTLINRVEVEDLKESGFNARVYATKYRTMLEETKENYVVYEMTVSAGPITKRNPWGYYVQTINERETISR